METFLAIAATALVLSAALARSLSIAITAVTPPRRGNPSRQRIAVAVCPEFPQGNSHSLTTPSVGGPGALTTTNY